MGRRRPAASSATVLRWADGTGTSKTRRASARSPNMASSTPAQSGAAPPASHLADQRLHCKLARGVIIGAVDRDPSAFAGPRLRVRQRLPVILVSDPPGELKDMKPAGTDPSILNGVRGSSWNDHVSSDPSRSALKIAHPAHCVNANRPRRRNRTLRSLHYGDRGPGNERRRLAQASPHSVNIESRFSATRDAPALRRRQ